jgi:bis(5'-nucleosidyl)-tetraphosphatase
MIREISIGAVVYNEDQFLLLKYGLGHWGLVKGHKDKGETDKDTILRELREETGIMRANIITGFKDRYSYHYNFRGKSFFKTVTCYLIKSDVKEITISYEHDDYKWLPYNEAIKKATHDGPKRMMKKAKKVIMGNLDTFIN